MEPLVINTHIMNRIFLGLSLLLASLTHAQFNQQWLSSYNGDGDYSDHFNCITEGESGSIYAAGYTQKTDQNADFLVCKFNASGQLVWSRSWRGSGQGPDIAYAVAFHNNTLYATGEVSNSGLGFDFFTIAVSTSGDSIWGAHYNDSQFNQYDQANAICVDPNGNIIVAGQSDRDPSSIINDDILTVKYSPTGSMLWVKRYNHTGNAIDRAVAVASDAQGNVTVAGRVANFSDDDYAVLQYNSSGNLNWSDFFDNGGIDRAADMGTDASGNIYVTGRSSNGNDDDFRTLKYSSSGTLLYNVIYDFVDNDRADFLDVNSDGSIVVAGRSDGSPTPQTNFNYRIVKYSADGAQQWTATFDGTAANDDIVQDVDLTSTGEVLVTGYSDANSTALIQNDIVSRKYSSTGSVIWTNTYNGTSSFDDEPGACIIDTQGRAWIAGHTENNTMQREALMIGYDAAGTVLSNAQWNGEGDNSDNVREIVKDNSGNVYACGYSVGKDTDRDMFLMKLNPSGDTLWTRSLSGTLFGSDEEANAIALDNAGNVLISGYTKNSGTGSDITIQKFNANGALQWTAQYNSPANESDRGYDVKTDASGNVFITGKTDIDPSPIITNDEIFTAKYTSAGTLAWSSVSNNGPGIHRGRSIYVGASGNIYVCGQSFNGTDEDIAVVKYSSTGSIVWQYTFNSASFDAFKASAFLSDESIVIAGTKSASGLPTDNSQAELIKVNSAGQLVWNATYEAQNSLSSTAEGIEVAPNGNIVFVGSAFNVQSPGSSDCITVCYSSTGSLLWADYYNSPSQLDDLGDALAVDNNNNIVVACHSNAGSNNDIHYTAHLRALNADGNLITESTLDESDTLTVWNDLLISGSTLYAGGSNWTASGRRDIIVGQYGVVLGLPSLENTLFSIYPNPTDDVITIALPKGAGQCTYQVFSTQGQLIASGKISGITSTFNCHDLPTGMYTLVVSSESTFQSATFIKN
jgi:uncharacterized delta-60 repeat protein